MIGLKALDLFLDLVELADAFERLFGYRRPVGGVHIKELAPDMGPASGLDDAVAGKQLVEPGVPVSMDDAAEVL
jgi:hypothetical protein